MRKYEVTWRGEAANTHRRQIMEGYSVADVIAGLYTRASSVNVPDHIKRPPVDIVELTVKEVFE